MLNYLFIKMNVIIDGDYIRKKYLKESIDEQRILFTFNSDGYMCVNKYCLIIDLVFRISKRLNELFINYDKIIFLDTRIIESDLYYQKLYHVSGYKNIKMKCKDIINASSNISNYDLAKLYFNYTHFTGCLQNIITSQEFEYIWNYIMNMIKKRVNENFEIRCDEVYKKKYDKILKINNMRKLLSMIKYDVMFINPLINVNLFDDLDLLYSKIKLSKTLKFIIGTYYETYINETYINDYKDYYIYITSDFFDQSLSDILKKFNKAYGYKFTLI